MPLHLRAHREAEDDRRDDEADRRALALHEGAVLDHVEARHDHLRRAETDRAGHQKVQRVDVEVGEHVQEDVVAANGHGREELLLVRGEVCVRQHHALRESGRAARIGERGQGVHPDASREAEVGFVGQQKIVETVDTLRRGVAGHRERTNAFEVGSDGVHDRCEGRVVQDRARSRVVDLKADLALLRLGVDRIHHPADLQRSVKGDDELDRIRHEDGHSVAWPDAPFGERRSELIAQPIDFAEGHAPVPHEERRLVADLARDFAQAVLESDLAVGECRRRSC